MNKEKFHSSPVGLWLIKNLISVLNIKIYSFNLNKLGHNFLFCFNSNNNNRFMDFATHRYSVYVQLDFSFSNYSILKVCHSNIF